MVCSHFVTLLGFIPLCPLGLPCEPYFHLVHTRRSNVTNMNKNDIFKFTLTGRMSIFATTGTRLLLWGGLQHSNPTIRQFTRTITCDVKARSTALDIVRSFSNNRFFCIHSLLRPQMKRHVERCPSKLNEVEDSQEEWMNGACSQ